MADWKTISGISMPTPEEILARQLRAYPGRTSMADVPAVEGRPDINSLYGRLATLAGTPVDYSGVEQVAQSRQDQGQRDFLAGLVLSQMGGEGGAPLGRALAAHGLEGSKPLRGNAADTGYFDPTSGKFIENPHLQRTRDERVITTRIDALVKEEENKAKLALAQGNAAAADVARQNLEVFKQTQLAINAQIAAANARRDEERNRILDDKNRLTGQKPLPAAQSKAWTENNTALRKIDEAIADVDKNKEAFGLHNYLPGDLIQRIPAKGYETGVSARAKVSDIGSLKIHDRSGAAVTAAEFPRLRPFIPLATDKADVVKTKLENLKREYELMNEEIKNYAGDMGYREPTSTRGATGDFGGGGWIEIAPGVRVREAR